MTFDERKLRARFERAVAAAGATLESRATFDELVSRYGEAHRHYHTLCHVKACLGWLDRFASTAEHLEEVELALWFHDAVCTPLCRNNERRSAEFARQRLSELGIKRKAVDRVVQHIEATKHHAAAGGDSALVCDLDLAVLGAAPSDFERFERQIEREYAQVPDWMFRSGRRRVLSTFLSRPQIYHVSSIRRSLETQARANLERRVRELG